MTGQAIEGWAIVELMGHRQRVGAVTEVEVFGGKMLRIDIPTEAGDVTEFYGCSSIYALRPVSEEIARDYAKEFGDPRPVRAVEYQIDDARQVLLDRYDAIIAGECDTCGRLMFVGERGYNDSEAGLTWCADHAPTWGDGKENWESVHPMDLDDEADIKAALAKIQKHLDGGGSLDDRITHHL